MNKQTRRMAVSAACPVSRTIPESVRKVEDIFYGCDALTTVVVTERRASEYEKKGFFTPFDMEIEPGEE